MGTVPTIGPKQRLDGLPGNNIPTSAPLEAFGGGAGLDRISGQVDRISDQTNQLLFKERAAMEDAALMKADGEATRKRLDRWLNPQTGFSTLKGEDAAKALDKYQKDYADDLEEISKGLGSDRQREMFERIRQRQELDLESTMKGHVAKESEKFKYSAADHSIKMSMEDAALGWEKKGKVQASISKALAAYDTVSAGLPESEFKVGRAKIVSDIHQGVIENMMSRGLAVQARDYHAANRKFMDKNAEAALVPRIDDSLAIHNGEVMWKAVEGMKLSDGSPDTERMRAYVMSDATKDFPDEMKLKMAEYVMSRAGQSSSDRNRKENATDRDFTNKVLEGHTAGQPMAQAMTLANAYSRDPYDLALKQKVVSDIYAPPHVNTDPVTYMELWEGIREGRTGRRDIDNQYMKGTISGGDFKSLREDLYNQANSGTSAESKGIWQRIKADLSTKVPDAKNQKLFLYELQQSTRGKSGDETWKIAQDKLKTVSIPWARDPQVWEGDLKARDQSTLDAGTLIHDLGENTMAAIGEGIAREKKIQNPNMGDYQAFAKDLGGYESILPGTANYAAIQILMANGVAVNATNIKLVLSKYPKGK